MTLVPHTRAALSLAAPQKEVGGAPPAVNGQDAGQPQMRPRWEKHSALSHLPITVRKTALPPATPHFFLQSSGAPKCRELLGGHTTPAGREEQALTRTPFLDNSSSSSHSPHSTKSKTSLQAAAKASQRPLLHAHLCSAPPESGLELLSLCNKLPSAARHQPVSAARPFHALAALPAFGIFFLLSPPHPGAF